MDEQTIDSILIGMQEQAANSDYEVAHYNADGNLIILIQLLSRSLPPEEHSKVQSILDAYEEVGKWYA